MTPAERKATPVYSGVLRYFPLALAAVAQLSKAGNDKHNPGEPLHWSRDKSNDHLDCVARHLLECGTIDPEDGIPHDVKLAWRALANLEVMLEAANPVPAPAPNDIPCGYAGCERMCWDITARAVHRTNAHGIV